MGGQISETTVRNPKQRREGKQPQKRAMLGRSRRDISMGRCRRDISMHKHIVARRTQ